MKSFTWPLDAFQTSDLFQAKLVTFDLFETLVCRPCGSRLQFQVYGPLGRRFRVLLEFVWRIFQKLLKMHDFQLKQLQPIFGDKVESEYRFDMAQLQPRQEILGLMFELMRRSIEIGIVSNTYYSESQIREICSNIGIPISVPLFLSSEIGITKRSGLFKKVFSSAPSPHWHFGDDLKEDSSVSDEYFVLVPSIWEEATNFGGVMERKSLINTRHFDLKSTLLDLAIHNHNETDGWFWFGAFFSGPLSVSIAQSLEDLSRKHSSSEVYCLARDGFLPYKYLKYRGNEWTHYVPYSRRISESPEYIERLYEWIEEQSTSEFRIFFDLGWRGVSSARMARRFKESGYLVLFGRWPWHDRVEHAVLKFGDIRSLATALKFRKFPEIFELALSAPHEGLVRLPNELSNWLEQEVFEQEGINFQIAKGADTFQKLWIKYGNRPLPLDTTLTAFHELISNPPKSALLALEIVTHEFNGHSYSLVSRGSDPITFWIRGAWLHQKAIGISFNKRLKNAGKEWSRRLGFRYSVKNPNLEAK